jgi:FkbM family methyltransferase
MASLENQIAALKTQLDNLLNFSRQKATFLGDYRVIASHPIANHIFFDTRCLLVTPQVITQTYELTNYNYLQLAIKPGMKCLEIGANQGYHTLTMALLVGESGHVVAFEANPETFSYLRDSVTSNGLRLRVTLENKAAFDKDGLVKFKRLTRHAAASHIDLYENDWTDELNDGDTISVPSVSLKNYLVSKNFVPDFVKIDAEGAEPYIFSELIEVIKQNQNIQILIEIVPVIFESVGGLQSFIAQVRALGLVFFSVNSSGTLTEATDEQVIGTQVYKDYVIAWPLTLDLAESNLLEVQSPYGLTVTGLFNIENNRPAERWRWAIGPETLLSFRLRDSKPLELTFRFVNPIEGQEVAVEINGVSVANISNIRAGAIIERRIKFQGGAGVNRVIFSSKDWNHHKTTFVPNDPSPLAIQFKELAISSAQ